MSERRRPLAALLALGVAIAIGAGAAPAAASTPPSTDSAPDFDASRMVVLAEEFLLADVLALGFEPIASTATVETVGLQGLGDYDTDGIDVLSMTELNLEQLATLEPSVIVTLQFWADEAGIDRLETIAPVIIVPDGLSGAEQATALGALLGRDDEAAALIADLDTATADAAARVPDDCVVSLAAIYSGPSVALFVDGPWELPSAVQSVGCTLEPGVELEHDQNGRAWIATEQLELLAAPTIVLLQTPTVEGEDAAIAEITDDPLWARLPAVEAGRVWTFDRLGYPGIEGSIRFLDEFASHFENAA